MPIYEYTCSQCQKLSDVLQRLNDPRPEKCPACAAEGTLSRVVSRTSFVLKGGGWGADLYGSKKASEKGDAAPAEGAKPADQAAPASPGTAASPAAATPGGASTPAPAAPSATPAKKDGGS
jgi:putative FmdB family regulatory protein